jgi:hypothetical protein
MTTDTKTIHEAIQTLTEAGVLRWYASTGGARADVFLYLDEDDDCKPFVTVNSSEVTEDDANAGEEVGTIICVPYPVTAETYGLIAARVPDLYTK